MNPNRPRWQNGSRTGDEKSHRPQTPEIVTIIGTAFLNLAEYLALLPPGQIVLVDVPNELDALRLRRAPGREVHVIPVGPNQTLQSIIRTGGGEAQQRALKKLPVINSRDGLAQLRAVGGAASRQLIQRREFLRLHEQELPNLHRMAGGELPSIRLTHFQGTAGGMASRGGIEIYDAIVAACLDECDVVETEVHLLGAVTFHSSEFKRTRENSAAALAEWLDKVRHPTSERVSLSLVCHEVYPVGKDKGRRDKLVIDQLQSLNAPVTAQVLRRSKSNKAADGPFGSARLVRSDHFRQLSTQQIAADAARDYLPLVCDASRPVPDVGLIKALRWRTRTERLPRLSVEGVLERALTSEPEGLIESLMRRGARLDKTPVLKLRNGTNLVLIDVTSTFSSPLRSLGQTKRRMKLLATCEAVCLDQIDELEGKLADLCSETDEIQKRVVRAVIQLQGTRWFAMFASDEARIAEAAESFSELRDNVDARVDVEAKIDALHRAISEVRRERTALSHKLHSLANLLKRCLPRGDERESEPTVALRPIDDIFGELLGLIEHPNASVEAMMHLLSQVIKTVTQHGLAEIVGAPDTTVEAIVRAVVDGRGGTRGPAWGGMVREDQPDRFIVYPPVDDNLARRLIAHHNDLPDGSTPVAFGSTAIGSANVVVLEVLNARDQSDVLVPFYAKGLDRALNSEIADLYIEDRDALARLGLLNNEPHNVQPSENDQ